MRKVLKAPNNLVKRVWSKTSQNSDLPSTERKSKSKAVKVMTDEEQLAAEIRALKDQIENLKAAVNALQNDTEMKEIAVAKLAREKEKVTMELLKEKRAYSDLLGQLEKEREFYYMEKEAYCREMIEIKKLKQSLSKTSAVATSSSTSTNQPKESSVALGQYKKDIEKIKQTLNQTLEANYNLSIKFLRMKNTKTCLKTELKTMRLEHEKLANDYKAKIRELSNQLDDIIQERLNSNLSCSSKKYLNLVKQNSCLVYENLCLQLEVDNLHVKCEKLKLDKAKSDTNARLKYIKHNEDAKSKKVKPDKHALASSKRVTIKEEPPERLENPSPSEQTVKIYERHELPGVPNIKIIGEQKQKGLIVKNVFGKAPSKLALFQVSSSSSKTASVVSGSLTRAQSSPEIRRFSSLS